MASTRPLSGENESVSEAGSANSVKSWQASRDVLQRRNDHLLQQHQAEVSALMARQQEQSMKLTHELEMSDMEYHNLVDQFPHHPDVITSHVSGDLWTASPPGVHPNMDPTLDTSDVIQPGLIDPSINVPTITPLSQTTPHNPHVSAGQSVLRSPTVVEYATENSNKPDVHTSYTCTGQSTENNGIPLYSTPMNNPFNDRWTASAPPAPQHRWAAALQSGYDNVVEYASVNNNETDDVITPYTCAVQSTGQNGVPLYSTPMNNPFNERWTAPVPLNTAGPQLPSQDITMRWGQPPPLSTLWDPKHRRAPGIYENDCRQPHRPHRVIKFKLHVSPGINKPHLKLMLPRVTRHHMVAIRDPVY